MLSLQSFTQTETMTAVATADTRARTPGLCIAAISADQQVQAGPVLGVTVTEQQEQSDPRFSLRCQLVMEWSGFAVSTLTCQLLGHPHRNHFSLRLLDFRNNLEL